MRKLFTKARRLSRGQCSVLVWDPNSRNLLSTLQGSFFHLCNFYSATPYDIVRRNPLFVPLRFYSFAIEEKRVCLDMEGDEHMNEVPSENSNLGSDSLEKENILEDEKEDLQDGLKLRVVTEEVSGVLLAENGCISLEDGSLKRSLETVGTCAKRARITVDEDQPSVHFTYNSLTRASRQKLQELLQKWSEWHAKHDASEVLESGEETFFPALHVGLEKTSAVSFWMENQTRNDKNKDFIPLADNTVPLYDCGYALGLTSADGSSNVDGKFSSDGILICKKALLGQLMLPSVADCVVVGMLCMYGLGELDPPTWLNRMRELGYPPGYLDVDNEDQPSGITIFTDSEIADQEDGEIMEADASKPKRKKTVKFPGINAPIPEKADERLWGTRAGPSSSDISRNLSLPQHRSNYSTDYGSQGYHREHRLGDLRDDGPPGDPGHSSSMFSFHPRFGGHDSALRSPSMARSQSDRGRSPMHDEESSMPFSFHFLHYSSSERYFWPLDQDSGRLGSWTSESMYYDRDCDFSSRFMDRSNDGHYRSWR
ncbi:hypothetical protein D0Y65_050452 [Glycine soja]|uniref:PSP proline-rich domain-containing protein n=1 Tax=Glycine soja TaxID=3848 RepID=A0A445FC49_GLYSO|nr:hypothetical protein D0Y65_050452 [Glycine soja]